jgi:nicotinamidase/pyrazinamidase
MRDPAEALIVIDVQNDFCPDGALAVTNGDAIIPGINRLIPNFSTVVLTQDWHPANHASFAANHPGSRPFNVISMDYGDQVLWPSHCVQGSKGAAFHPDLDTAGAHSILRKGFRPQIDSYSAFFENDRMTSTGLEGYLRARGIHTVTLVGLATDYCVAYSALDAVRLGFRAVMKLNLCRAIDLDGSLAEAIDELADAGVVMEG